MVSSEVRVLFKVIALVFLSHFFLACEQEDTATAHNAKWKRSNQNPVFRDQIPNENYQVASDGHIFYDNAGNLNMIYTGDTNGKPSIKLANGNSFTNWSYNKSLIFNPGLSNLDTYKETPFYRLSNNGKHQIYYIGYPDEETYQSQIFLAESDVLDGNYTQTQLPIIARGSLAGKNVYCITSPSIVEHNGLLYIAFIGWNNSPENVSEVWIIGATSSDDGHTWSDFKIVDAPIGMEGQITKISEGNFVAVSTQEFNGKEAIFYATSNHPFGPWSKNETPILIQDNSILEKDEIIAPQISFDPITNKEYLYYTGADHKIGWWMMLAEKY